MRIPFLHRKPATEVQPQLIRPEGMIAERGVDGLLETARAYFDHLDPQAEINKPFAQSPEAPQSLYRLALLLEGLHLGKSMIVLDFGAGACWLSRMLSQMGCVPIAVDPSPSALAAGRQLFAHYPVTFNRVGEPRFLVFDGKRIECPDESVDRIACYDAFHHVPNQEAVLAEMARILKPGGIAGFAEPGRGHSRSALSQYEMRHFRVLEANIEPEKIFEAARRHGFTDIRFAPFAGLVQSHSLEDYLRIVRRRPRRSVVRDLLSSLTRETQANSIFFLHKGPYQADSRSPTGLAHELTASAEPSPLKTGTPFWVAATAKNAGTAKWLHTNHVEHGVVKLGLHLEDREGRTLSYDFYRQALPRDVAPGETVDLRLDAVLDKAGDYTLTLDLVAEQVAWFESSGSRPVHLRISVRE